MAEASKLDYENPCASCNETTPDGLLCDGCSGWWCKCCINCRHPGTLPDALYQVLQTIPSFAWTCPDCADLTLPQQLLINEVIRKNDLLKYGSIISSLKVRSKVTKPKPQSATYNEDCPESQVGPGSPVLNGEQMLSAFKEMMSAQVQMVCSIQENQRKDRERDREQERRERQEEFKLIIEAIKSPQNASPAAYSRSENQSDGYVSSTPTMSNLPKVQLPTFSGNILDWPNFWDSFQVNVHDQMRLQPKQKIDYLHQVLKGPALDKIKGLGLQGDKYDEAIAILRREYGQPYRLEEESWKLLRELVPVKENLANLEKFMDDIRTTTATLHRMGISNETLDCCVGSLFMPKLPHSLQTKLKDKKILQGTLEERWKLAEFLDRLHDIKLLYQYSPSTKQLKQSSKETTLETFPPAAFSFVQAARGKKPTKCAFCQKSNHFSDECKTYSQISQRREIAQNQKLCFNCLSKGHLAQNCRREKECFYCRVRGHHCALCFKNRKIKSSGQTRHVAIQNVVEITQVKQERENTSDQSNEVFLAGTQEEDGIIMATPRVMMSNIQTSKRVALNIYMDSGARYTCIDEKAAFKLGLEPSHTVQLDTARFNSPKSEKIKAGVVCFKLHGPNGFEMVLNAYSIPQMTPPLPLYPVKLSPAVKEKFIATNQSIRLPTS